jgi:hypothetical protein
VRGRVAAAGAATARAAAASQARVGDAARGALRIGNAVDAVIAGVLASAAESPTVLLGPFQLLVGGAGAGLLALDGRVRQPGLGVPRPRGFLAGEKVPASALVAVPALPAAVAAASAVLGALALTRVAGPAIELARASSPERARFIERLVHRGVPGLADDPVASELLAAAGRPARGLLTPDDLRSVLPALVRCDESGTESGGLLTIPWRGESGKGRRTASESSATQVVAACDARGLVAVACYESPLDGLAIPALGVIAPLLAAPVMRGAARVRPGESRAASAPIALRIRGGVVDLGLGIVDVPDGERSIADAVRSIDDVKVWMQGLQHGRLVAVARSRDVARVIASA